MENTNIFFPIEKQIGSRATHATPGGSLRERLAAARQKPVVEPSTVDIPEKPETVVEVPMVENSEPDSRIIKRTMNSKVFGGNVDLVFNLDEPDQAAVGSVKYTNAELADLKSRGLSAADLMLIHETKKSFDGSVIPSDEG